jgi:hypothetical protein
MTATTATGIIARLPPQTITPRLLRAIRTGDYEEVLTLTAILKAHACLIKLRDGAWDHDSNGVWLKELFAAMIVGNYPAWHEFRALQSSITMILHRTGWTSKWPNTYEEWAKFCPETASDPETYRRIRRQEDEPD